MTPEEAQARHEQRQKFEKNHDLSSCYCCCTDCETETVPIHSDQRTDQGRV